MNTKTNADSADGAQVLSNDELMDVHGGQEEIAIVPFIGGYLAGKALDYAWERFSAFDRTVLHAPYTDAYARAIDANNDAEREEEFSDHCSRQSTGSAAEQLATGT